MRTRLAALVAALSLSALADPPIRIAPSVNVSVGTSATALASNGRHVFIEVCNTDTSKELRIAFSSTVTTSTGRPLQPGACLQFSRLTPGDTLYGVTSSGTLAAVVTEGFQQ